MADAVTLARAIIEIGTNGIPDAEKQLNALDAELTKVGSDYAAGTIRIDEYLSKSQRLQSQIDELSDGIETAEKAVKKYGSTTAAAAALADRSARSTLNLGQAALEGSRALEDLQYGIGGVVNNIPGLVTMLGGSAGLAAAFSLVTVGINQLVKHWDDLRGLFETRNPVPPATDTLERYEDALQHVNTALDELKSKTSLNYEELARFKKLTEEQADLEQRVAQERETAANKQAHGQFANEANRAAAQGFARALNEAGGYEKVIERFVLAQRLRTGEGEDAIPAIRRNYEQRFNAALRGDQFFIKQIAELSQKDQRGITGLFHRDIARFSPEAQRAEEDRKANEKLIAELNKQGREGEEAMRAAQGRELIDALNKQGQEGEHVGLAGAKRAAKEKADAAKLARDSTKAHITRQIEAENRSIAAGGYVEKAEALLAQTRAAGGAMVNGRFRKMNEDQILDYVNAQVQKELHRVIGLNQFGQQVRANAGMNKERTEEMATVITSRANTDLQKRLTEMGADSVNNTQALLGITQQLIGAVGNLQRQQAMLRGEIATAARQTRALQRTALSRPGG